MQFDLDWDTTVVRIRLDLDGDDGGNVFIRCKAKNEQWSEATLLSGSGWSVSAILELCGLADKLMGMGIQAAVASRIIK